MVDSLKDIIFRQHMLMLLNYTTDETIPIDVIDFIKEKEYKYMLPRLFNFDKNSNLPMIALRFITNL